MAEGYKPLGGHPPPPVPPQTLSDDALGKRITETPREADFAERAHRLALKVEKDTAERLRESESVAEKRHSESLEESRRANSLARVAMWIALFAFGLAVWAYFFPRAASSDPIPKQSQSPVAGNTPTGSVTVLRTVTNGPNTSTQALPQARPTQPQQ